MTSIIHAGIFNFIAARRREGLLRLRKHINYTILATPAKYADNDHTPVIYQKYIASLTQTLDIIDAVLDQDDYVRDMLDAATAFDKIIYGIGEED